MIVAHVCTRTPLRRLDQSGWKLLKKLPRVPDVDDYQHMFSYWELILLHSYVYKLYTLCGIADLKTCGDMYVPTCLQTVLAFIVHGLSSHCPSRFYELLFSNSWACTLPFFNISFSQKHTTVTKYDSIYRIYNTSDTCLCFNTQVKQKSNKTWAQNTHII